MLKSSEKSVDGHKKVVGERLKIFANYRFESVSALARALDMHPNSFHSGYIGGRHYPGGEMLIKLLYAGCDIAWLLVGEGLPPEPNREELDRWFSICKATYEREDQRLRLGQQYLDAEIERLSQLPDLLKRKTDDDT